MDATPLKLLEPGECYNKIRVRICRIWRTYNINTNNPISFNCLLIDEDVRTLTY